MISGLFGFDSLSELEGVASAVARLLICEDGCVRRFVLDIPFGVEGVHQLIPGSCARIGIVVEMVEFERDRELLLARRIGGSGRRIQDGGRDDIPDIDEDEPSDGERGELCEKYSHSDRVIE